MKKELLINEAKRWVGVSEIGGDNKGQLVEIFQKAVDGKSQGEAWCMAFVQYCLQQVDKQFAAATGQPETSHKLFKTEHVRTCWNNSPKELRRDTPQVGDIILWQHFKDGVGTTNGHCGVIVALDPDPNYIITVEGNTGASQAVERNGDGVFQKRRSVKGAGTMKVLGFLTPWL